MSFFELNRLSFLYIKAGDRYESRSKWDDDWEGNKGGFPFSEKLGEISDKIGSTINDTINTFRKKDRDDSPDRFRSVSQVVSNVPYLLFLHTSRAELSWIRCELS